jgi:NAD(P)-dependent dehydrogenase (short-subunit alcohol dehydrogenase family)
MQLKPVEEQVVALMGASSGIEREAALRFAKRGARVVVSARNEEGLNSLVQEILGRGGEATAVVAEVTDFDQVKAVADRAERSTGGSTPGCTSPRWVSSPHSSRRLPKSSRAS